jgi:hypothetical protein
MPILHHCSPGRSQCILTMICCVLVQYCIFYYLSNHASVMISIRNMFAASNSSYSTRSADQLITPISRRKLDVNQSNIFVRPIAAADEKEDTFDANCTCSHDSHTYNLCFRTNEGLTLCFTFNGLVSSGLTGKRFTCSHIEYWRKLGLLHRVDNKTAVFTHDIAIVSSCVRG